MLKNALTSDPRLTKADAYIELAFDALKDVQDPKARDALHQVITAVLAMRAVLADWEAESNNWPLPSATPRS